MHYANGREPKIGDFVIGYSYASGKHSIGIVVAIHPQAQTCNCAVAYSLSVLSLNSSSFLLSPAPFAESSTCEKLLHIDDYIASLNPVQVVEGEQAPVL